MESNEAQEVWVEQKEAVDVYLCELKAALKNTSRQFIIKKDSPLKDMEYRTDYTIATLFPDEQPKAALRRELGKLEIHEYIENRRDSNPKFIEPLWLFGRTYNEKEVYIKLSMREEGCSKPKKYSVKNLSFHFAEFPLETFKYQIEEV